FSRGSGAARGDRGAGLGLAIVRAIAEAHHGRVDLRSAPGVGSTFTLVIPTGKRYV
ncbi:ATP-binding protein, partial [Nocardiopsis sp. TNDT3]